MLHFQSKIHFIAHHQVTPLSSDIQNKDAMYTTIQV